MDRFDPEKKIAKNRDLEFYKIPNSDEVNGIYLASPQAAKPSAGP